jgi:hypothetical protein
VHEFGFFLSLDYSETVPQMRPRDEVAPAHSDSLGAFGDPHATGWSLGMHYQRRIYKGLSARVVPSLNFLGCELDHCYYNGTIERISFERTEIGLAVQPMYTPQLTGPSFAYLAGGVYVGYAPAQTAMLVPISVRFDYGMGIGSRLKYFSITGEARIAVQTNNLLVQDGSFYADVVERLGVNVFSLRLILQA